MKIKRFRETKNKWSENDIKDHLGNDSFLKEKLSEFILWKTNEFSNPYVENFYYYDDDNICLLHFYTDVSENETYEVVDTDEMIDFINNTETYKNSKNYNL